MFVSGLSQVGVFITLKASPRIWRWKRSVKANVRKMEASRDHDPGPLMTFGPRLPNWRLPGWAKQSVVTVALQTFGVNQGCPSFGLPFGVGMEPPKKFNVFELPGAPSTPSLPTKPMPSVFNGVPLKMDKIPLTCQPPKTAPPTPCVKNFLPFPNGSS